MGGFDFQNLHPVVFFGTFPNIFILSRIGNSVKFKFIRLFRIFYYPNQVSMLRKCVYLHPFVFVDFMAPNTLAVFRFAIFMTLCYNFLAPNKM